MNTEPKPNLPMKYPDPSQAELWDSAAAAVARARANLGPQPEIVDGAHINREVGRIIGNESVQAAVDTIPDSPGQHPDVSTGEVREVRYQVADSHFDAGRIPGRTPASQQPTWATEPTGEKPVTGTPAGHFETQVHLDAEDLTMDRGPRPPYIPKHSSDEGVATNPWASGQGRFPTIQQPSDGQQLRR